MTDYCEGRNILKSCIDERGTPTHNFKIDFNTGLIHFHEVVDGIDFRFPTEKTDLIEAKKMAKIRISKYFRENDGKAPAPKHSALKGELALLVKHYEAKAASGDIAPGTVATTKLAVSKLEPFWGDKAPSEITRDKWEEYQTWFENTYNGQNQFGVKKTMNVLVTHLLEKGLISRRPSIKDRTEKRARELRKRKKSKIFNDVEVVALDKACLNDIERLGIQLGYMMGFRISDVMNLSWDRINLEHNPPYINFTEGDDKADYTGKCPVPDSTVEILRRLEPNKAKSNWVFHQKKDPSKKWKTQIFDSLWRLIKIRSGVTHGSFHGLRHYRLTRDFKNPAFTPAQVCMIRRVSMAVAAEHYIHPELSDLEILRNSGVVKILSGSEGR